MGQVGGPPDNVRGARTPYRIRRPSAAIVSRSWIGLGENRARSASGTGFRGPTDLATLNEVIPAPLLGVLVRMPSGAELLRQIKEQIKEVDPREAHDTENSGYDAFGVGVREQHE